MIPQVIDIPANRTPITNLLKKGYRNLPDLVPFFISSQNTQADNRDYMWKQFKQEEHRHMKVSPRNTNCCIAFYYKLEIVEMVYRLGGFFKLGGN